MKKKTMKKELVPYVLLLLAAFFILFTTDIFGGKIHELTYNEFETNLKNNKITELTIVPRRDGMIYDVSGKLEGYKDKESFYSTLPLTDATIERILEAKDAKDFKVVAKSDPASGFFIQFLFNVFPLILLMGFAIFYLNRQMSSGNKSMDFGKSRARLSEDNGHTTFKNVAGLIEEKEEVKDKLEEILEDETIMVFDNYDYDSAFEHGLWGAVRESSLLKCTNPAHQYHCVPDIEDQNRLKSVLHDCVFVMNKTIQFLDSVYGIPRELLEGVINYELQPIEG